MRAPEVTSLAIQESSPSIDPRRLEQPAPQHTYSNHFDFNNESIDESFLASFHSIKHSSSSSPNPMGTPGDYSDVNEHNEYNDFTLFSGDFMQEVMHSLRQPHSDSDIIVPSIETEVNRQSDQQSPYSQAAGPTSHNTILQDTRDHLSRFRAPTHGPKPSRGALRPLTPQISISTDVDQSRMATDMNGTSVAMRDEEPPRSYSGPSGVSPSVVLTMWEEPGSQLLTEANQFQSPTDGVEPGMQESGYFNSQHSSSTAVPISSEDLATNPDTEPLDDEGTERNKKVPKRRHSLPSGEVKNSKDQEREAELESRLNHLKQWMENGMNDAAFIDSPSDSTSPGNTSASAARDTPQATGSKSTSQDREEPDDSADIRPVSPTQSIHQNEVVDGQYYIHPGATNVNDADLMLVARLRRQFQDAPAVLSTTLGDEGAGRETAMDMITRFNAMADNMSIMSRKATWGTTRRQSAPSIADTESVTSGSLFKRMSFGRGADVKGGLLTNVRNLYRKNSNANKLKRNRSDAGISPRSPLAPDTTTGGPASLAPPRTQSANRRRSRSPQMPQIQTNIGDLLMPPGYASHGRRKSTSGASPTSSVADFFHAKRSRSKSDAVPRGGIAEQWKAQGGPPVVIPSPRDDDHLNSVTLQEYSDADGDGDDDDDEDFKVDESLVPNFNLQIVPSMDGYKDNIRAINPHIEGYLCDRLAHDQSVRYKCLLGAKIKHEAYTRSRPCPSAPLCAHLGSQSKPISPKAKGGRNSRVAHHDGGSDSNPENKLGPENFPAGIPKPPTDKFPAKLECPFCFKPKEFYKPSDWTKHVQEDISPFTCTWRGCKDAKPFKRKADYVRHENEKHRHLESWNCNRPDCTHVCYRKDNFQNHLVREHRMADPKARTKAQIQHASGYDFDFWQIVDSCHRLSSAAAVDEPCKFCQATFNSWKKLFGHLAKHMEQIALPILQVVKDKQVDEGTVISPVGPRPSSKQPQTPARSVAHSSPYSQGHGSDNISPGGHDMDLFPVSTPHSMQHTPALENNQSRFFQFPPQPQNYGMMNPVTDPRRGVNMSPSTSSASIDSRYNSVSPAQHNIGYGDVGGLAGHLGKVGMGNNSAQYQSTSHGASGSISHPFGSSMMDATSPVDLPTATTSYPGFSAAPMGLPMSAAAYASSMGMPTFAPQAQHGLPTPRFHGEIDPDLALMDQTFGGLGQALNYDGPRTQNMGMQRSRSNPNTFGMHPAQQQQLQQHQQHRNMQQQHQQYQGNAAFIQQQQSLQAQSVFHGNRPRSTSGARAPGWQAGVPPNSFGMNYQDDNHTR